MLVMPQAEGGLFEEIKQRLPEEKKATFDAYLTKYLDFGNIFTRSETDMVALNQEFGQYYLAVINTSLPTEGAVINTPLPAEGEAGGWMTHAMYFSMGQQHDYRAALQTVDAPVLVIHGADDLQSEAVSHVYAEVFPRAKFRVIAGATHFAFIEQPETFATIVGEFLNTVEKTEMSSK
jgi:proline iminopeptidase